MVALFLALEIAVIVKSDDYMPKPADAAIILGHSLIDGYHPDTILVERLEKGLSLYEEGLYDSLIVTGGKGPTDNFPVANAMAKWLYEQGVPYDKILIEDTASNTYENMKYSKQIAVENGFDSVVVVTSDFHIFRSMMIGEKFFDEISGTESKSEHTLKTTMCYIKEPFSIVKNFVLSFFRSGF